MSMKILVTGGAGFIGSNFIRHIINKYPEYEVVNLDKLTYAGNLNNLHDIEHNSRYTFTKGDICDKKTVDKALNSGIDTVVNFAAETHVDRSITDASSFVTTDVVGTHTLLEAALKHDVEKYIQISTDEVYGSIDTGSFREDDMLQPSSPYSASKAGGDLLVGAYHTTYGLPALITRSSNNFGPYQYPEKLIPLFITNALQGKKLPLYGDGMNVRDWLHVDDNCKAIDLVLHKGRTGEIYNIGSSEEHTNIEITKLILDNLKLGGEAINFVEDRPGHDRRYSLDTAKIKKLGWAPESNFEEAIRKTVLWYKNNRWWWQPLIQ